MSHVVNCGCNVTYQLSGKILGSALEQEFCADYSCDAAGPGDVEGREQCNLVAEALKRGKLGFGFSAGGLLFPYYLGVVQTLHQLNVITGALIDLTNNHYAVQWLPMACMLIWHKCNGGMLVQMRRRWQGLALAH